jgi:AcrR family transcriptional regulator
MAKTRERILESAQDLFYRQGYQATVVNQIISDAGVSKPTFYSHFPSKEELCVSTLQRRREVDLEGFREAIRAQSTPYDRFMAPIQALQVRMVQSCYRGCGFFNMLIEITDPKSPILNEIRRFNDGFRTLLHDVTLDLANSGGKFADIDVDHVANAYYLIFGGAIMFSQEYQEPWPLELAVDQVAHLV